ncbi:hypothetical protein LLG95_08795 [bacterium]|nr:hypothetical protein [bacterium]
MDNQSIIYLVLGLALGLFGWLLYWAGLPLIGGVIGASAGAALGYVAATLLQGPAWAIPVGIGAGLVLGAILGVFLMRALQLYFFFAVGAILGGSAGFHFIQSGMLREYIGGPGSMGAYVTICLLALVGGLLLVKLRRFIVAFVTSVIGAILFTSALKPEWQGLGLPVSFIVFLAIQIGLVRRFVDIEKFDRRAVRYRSEHPEKY